MDDNIQFQNADSYRGSSGKFQLTFKQIILMHINRCVLNGSTEWVGGFWESRQTGAMTERRYVPSTREVYNNSVKMLRALLKGYFDKPMTDTDTEIQETLKQIDSKGEKTEEEDKNKLVRLREQRVDTYIKLFEELVMLSKRLNFFEEESVEEEM